MKKKLIDFLKDRGHIIAPTLIGVLTLWFYDPWTPTGRNYVLGFFIGFLAATLSFTLSMLTHILERGDTYEATQEHA